MTAMTVRHETENPLAIVPIDRSDRRHAVDVPMAAAPARAIEHRDPFRGECDEKQAEARFRPA
jgi:hypothetical protein